jgi:type II secretory pathway pseudopilin PulG
LKNFFTDSKLNIKGVYMRISKNETALGLVEALIALAVVGTGMVVLTTISLKTIKRARKNELQDVAIQTGVEAMDFMKDPAPVHADLQAYWSITDDGGHYFSLDMSGSIPKIVGSLDTAEIETCDTGTYSVYGVKSLTDYVVCQQIKVESDGGSSTKFNIEVIVVWQTVGGVFEKRLIKGYRLGEIKT